MKKEYAIKYEGCGISAERMEALRKRFDISSDFGGIMNSEIGNVLDRVVEDLGGEIMFEEDADPPQIGEQQRHYILYDPPGGIFFDGWVSEVTLYGLDHAAIERVRQRLEEKSEVLKFKEIENGREN